MKKALLFVVLLTPFLLLNNCGTCNSQYTYQPPEEINDEIQVSSLTDVGMDSGIIAKGIKQIFCGKFNEIHSMLIYKDNHLVVEEYFAGYKYQWDAPNYQGEFVQWDREMLHPIMSCAKSYTSALIGIAIKKGFIKSVNQSIFDYLPDHQQFKSGGKENITIEHLLTMTSGLAWNEWGAAHGTSANDIDRIYFECSDDPITCVLERELLYTPGEVFNYNGGGIIILGEIINNASGLTVEEFAKTYLFKQLGINSSQWYQFNNGVYAIEGSLSLRPRDMLKFGILYLQNGIWQGKEVLSKEWINKSSNLYKNNNGIKIPIEDSGKNGYGYTWWITTHKLKGEKINMYRANGWGGQTIMVFPDVKMVVVFTSGNFPRESKLFKLVNNYVLPAIN